MLLIHPLRSVHTDFTYCWALTLSPPPPPHAPNRSAAAKRAHATLVLVLMKGLPPVPGCSCPASSPQVPPGAPRSRARRSVPRIRAIRTEETERCADCLTRARRRAFGSGGPRVPLRRRADSGVPRAVASGEGRRGGIDE